METRITPRVKTHKAWRVVRVCGPGREQPAGATSVCQSLIPGRSAGDDAVHALQHIFPMTGLSWRRTRLKRGLAARLSSCIRDRGNVGGSPTPGNHTAETALAGGRQQSRFLIKQNDFSKLAQYERPRYRQKYRHSSPLRVSARISGSDA